MAKKKQTGYKRFYPIKNFLFIIINRISIVLESILRYNTEKFRKLYRDDTACILANLQWLGINSN